MLGSGKDPDLELDKNGTFLSFHPLIRHSAHLHANRPVLSKKVPQVDIGLYDYMVTGMKPFIL